MRLMAKALGRNVIIASATGCMEIVSSPLPYTAWRVPWIHVAFENTAAVASGKRSHQVLAVAELLFEGQEGLRAFLEKRPARFEGR